MIESISKHHLPEQTNSNPPALAGLIALSNIMAHQMKITNGVNIERPEISKEDVLEDLKVTSSEYQMLTAQAREVLSVAETVIQS